MNKKSIFFCALIFLCYSVVFAEGEKRVEYDVIAFAFKNISKAYIAVVDMAKLKKDNIRSLKAMDEVAFRKKYARILKGINELPQEYRVKYGLSAKMNKNEAVKIINSWNKKRLYAMIDDVPQDVISKYFKEYMQKNKQKVGAKDLLLNIKDFWERIVQSSQSHERQDVRKNN